MQSTPRAWYREVHWQILLSMVAGLVAGVGLGERATWFSPLAEIFLRLLRMVIVPLVISSLIVGTTSIGDAASVGRLGMKAGLYYIVSSAAAILVGMVTVNLIRPGVGAELPVTQLPEELRSSVGSLGDIVLRIIPENPIRAMADGDMMGIIFFALLVGLFTNRLPQGPRQVIGDLASSLFELMMQITAFVLRLAPLGVFALMARMVGSAGLEVFEPLLKYMATVLISLAVHAFVTLPLALWLISGRSPWAYAQALAPALLTAFSSSSSSATLPLTIDCVERRAGVPNQVSSFVLPLGATVNMDGTALYECVAVIFIAQVYGISLGLGQQVVIFLTALLASIGAAGIPMAGLVMMAVVLRAVGLPLEGVGLILAVDRVLDMCRTTVNVWSDTVGAALVARWEGYDAAESATSKG